MKREAGSPVAHNLTIAELSQASAFPYRHNDVAVYRRVDAVGESAPGTLVAYGHARGTKQLRDALGMSWNTLGTPRERVAELLGAAGMTVRDEGPWRRFSHRVDSSVHRDVIVAVREG